MAHIKPPAVQVVDEVRFSPELEELIEAVENGKTDGDIQMVDARGRRLPLPESMKRTILPLETKPARDGRRVRGKQKQ